LFRPALYAQKRVALFISGCAWKISKKLEKTAKALKQYGCYHRYVEITFFDENRLAYVTRIKCADCNKLMINKVTIGRAE
jgi:hypothetical protein